jgi:cyclophilin family peptidyl-prolyl cis-trans isomerase
VFGKVIAGMDVVDKIAATPTGPGGPFPRDVPQTRVMIESAKVVSQ